MNSNLSLNNNENIPSSNNIHKDGTFNNDSNIVKTNHNLNYILSLNNNENNSNVNNYLNNENDYINYILFDDTSFNNSNNDNDENLFDNNLSFSFEEKIILINSKVQGRNVKKLDDC